MNEPTSCWYFWVTGRVQGVGFRGFVESYCRRNQIAGWVRNVADGTVELMVRLRSSDWPGLVEALRQGPPLGRVDSLMAGEVGAGLADTVGKSMKIEATAGAPADVRKLAVVV